jgi:hypothetical protein
MCIVSTLYFGSWQYMPRRFLREDDLHGVHGEPESFC